MQKKKSSIWDIKNGGYRELNLEEMMTIFIDK